MAEVAVIGIPDEKWGETVTALVVLAEGASASEAEIIAFCKQRLAGYKAPTFVEFRGGDPWTATREGPGVDHPHPSSCPPSSDAPEQARATRHGEWTRAPAVVPLLVA